MRQALQRINDAWLHGPSEEIPSKLEPCFHDQIVMIGPAFQELGCGRQAVAKSYQDFVQQAKVKNCKLAEPSIHITRRAGALSTKLAPTPC